MNFNRYVLLLLLLSWSLNAYGEEKRGNIHIAIDNLRSSQGQVRVRLFNKPQGFPISGEKALESRMLKIKEGRVETLFQDLPYGEYAIGALHDENDNGKMDLKWGVWPNEGVGASNNPSPGLTPTSFKKARFILAHKVLDLKIHIHY